jgi:polysaccharide export outer membrane protein
VPVAERAEFKSAGFIPAEALPPYPPASTPVPAQQVPEMTSEPVGVPKTVAQVGALAGELDSILPDQDYVIGPQDLLAIDVWHEPELSQSVPVRPDGKISLPLVGDMEVSGLTPRLLQARLAKELDAYIHKPQVTVIVREVNSRKFYIIGQIERPGTYPLSAHMTVLDALATAGGFRDFAKVQQIYLLRLRPDGSRNRLHFDYKAAVNGKASYRDIELQIGDTLVVP